MDFNNLINSFFGSSEGIWLAIKKFALIGSREATQMMLQMYYCLKSPSTPAFDKAIIVAGLGYQLLPKDAMTVDKYRLLGLLDNGITLALAYGKVRSNVTPEITNQVDAILEQWFPATTATMEAPRELPGAPSFPKVIPSTGTVPEGGDNQDDLIVD